MKRLLLILSFTLLASATNASERNAAPSELLASFGRAQFVEHCASCHGMKGRGDGPAATSLKIAPADLTRIATRRDGIFPDGDIAAIIDGRT
jgi:mono/diheme cytochrome c family protein